MVKDLLPSEHSLSSHGLGPPSTGIASSSPDFPSWLSEFSKAGTDQALSPLLFTCQKYFCNWN